MGMGWGNCDLTMAKSIELHGVVAHRWLLSARTWQIDHEPSLVHRHHRRKVCKAHLPVPMTSKSRSCRNRPNATNHGITTHKTLQKCCDCNLTLPISSHRDNQISPSHAALTTHQDSRVHVPSRLPSPKPIRQAPRPRHRLLLHQQNSDDKSDLRLKTKSKSLGGAAPQSLH
ncbi:hypothetical protein EJ05DRAFT_250243 [Pseudovirgaria hyperparasitica]|uniref:Uncharacterized protein n=1 Tax=Pseudovirgaria hyperparasitica TaxID=470096 RepID=A0A6A6WDX5_9PEZI|nr:uncharacterized protein EJ05DRAFT_250243 [Pseudovirgaria hyperparasitica]KAF2761018.1 hypothetical protein EJ05DRAFT_250243 [Pseudovirgaria hyperparasitica]